MPFRLSLELDDQVVRWPLAQGSPILGSAEDCDLRIRHFTVSRRHARLEVQENRVWLEDLGSSNGTRLDGRILEGRVEVTPGQPLLFGSVPASLEEVRSEELEVAISLGERSEPISDAPLRPRSEEPTTFSLGSLKVFTLKHLPVLLNRVVRDDGVLVVAQAVGAALYESLPCCAVRILPTGKRDDAMLFSAEARDRAHSENRKEVIAGDLTLQVDFLHRLQGESFGPLLESCASLLELAQSGPDLELGRQAEVSAPLLPDPPSVEPEIAEVYGAASRVALGDISILVTGESGTGKEVLARYIHAASGRAGQTFVALNCAALPRDLLEAELFGVEKGAATGVEARPGRFELAHEGTLFLDEIGDMALGTQAKILRVLQEGEVFRLGARTARPVSVRTVAATNQDLDTELERGGFRRDLYYRIADWRVRLPALRERCADIVNLAAFFLNREARRRGISVRGISRAAVDSLESYEWPGNIRELEREMARAALFMENGEILESRHLKLEIREARRQPPKNLESLLEEVERKEIRRVLNQCDQDTVSAAHRLGVARSTLYRRIKKLGLSVPSES